IAVDNVSQTGTYPLTSNDGVSGNALTFIKDLGSTSQVIYWTIDPSITDKGSVTITALNNHYIEGMFTAFCKNDNNTGEVAHISNGSFKGNFRPNSNACSIKDTAGNRRLGNMAGDEYRLNFLFAIRLQFQQT